MLEVGLKDALDRDIHPLHDVCGELLDGSFSRHGVRSSLSGKQKKLFSDILHYIISRNFGRCGGHCAACAIMTEEIC